MYGYAFLQAHGLAEVTHSLFLVARLLLHLTQRVLELSQEIPVARLLERRPRGRERGERPRDVAEPRLGATGVDDRDGLVNDVAVFVVDGRRSAAVVESEPVLALQLVDHGNVEHRIRVSRIELEGPLLGVQAAHEVAPVLADEPEVSEGRARVHAFTQRAKDRLALPEVALRLVEVRELARHQAAMVPDGCQKVLVPELVSQGFGLAERIFGRRELAAVIAGHADAIERLAPAAEARGTGESNGRIEGGQRGVRLARLEEGLAAGGRLLARARRRAARGARVADRRPIPSAIPAVQWSTTHSAGG
jgi:hypothetical protein